MTTKLPRAPSSFMLYRADEIKKLQEESEKNPGSSSNRIHMRDMSKQASITWKDVPQEIRNHYAQLSIQRRQEIWEEKLENRPTGISKPGGKSKGKEKAAQKAPPGAPIVPVYTPSYVIPDASTISEVNPPHPPQSNSPSREYNTRKDPGDTRSHYPGHKDYIAEFQAYADRVRAMKLSDPKQLQSIPYKKANHETNKKEPPKAPTPIKRSSAKDPYADYIPSKYPNIEALEQALLEQAGVVPDRNGKFKRPYEDLPFTAAAFAARYPLRESAGPSRSR